MVERLVNSEANNRRIAMVESCFGTSGQPLAIPGRVLVGEGVLTKMCRKKPKPRQFFLFNDILVYGNIVINKKKYNKQHIIPLEEVKLDNIEDEGVLKNGWLMCTAIKSFAVFAATATEKSEWMAHINKCVEDLLRKSGKKPTTVHAAVWIPDSEAVICMHCKRTQFTVLSRRHHCRKCGAVVCNPCSNKKFLLPSQSSKPLRVCLTCYDELCKAKFGQTTSSLPEQHSVVLDNTDLDPDSIPGKNMDSSGEDDSDDDEEPKNGSGHMVLSADGNSDRPEPKFYGDSVKDGVHENFNEISHVVVSNETTTHSSSIETVIITDNTSKAMENLSISHDQPSTFNETTSAGASDSGCGDGGSSGGGGGGADSGGGE